MSVAISREEVEFWKENGYLIKKGVFRTEELEQLRSGYDDIMELCASNDVGLQDAAVKAHIFEESDNEVWVDIRVPPEQDGRDGKVRSNHIRKVEWVSLLHPAFERVRTSKKFFGLLSELMKEDGEDEFVCGIKSYKNQINFKNPGATEVHFPWHQDHRPIPAFRYQGRSYVQTIIAVDEHTEENGCLYVVPGTHKRGRIGGERYDGTVESVVDVSKGVACVAEPGDVVMFSSYLVHGSRPNLTDRPRRAYINGFVRGDRCAVGKWAFAPGGIPAVGVPVTSETDFSMVRRVAFEKVGKGFMDEQEAKEIDDAISEKL